MSTHSAPRSMTVAGIMSGTSADGVDVAIVRITAAGGQTRLKLIGHAGFPYTPALRRAVLAAMNAPAIPAAELARLNWRLGLAYAEAFAKTRDRFGVRIDLAGCHGQTIYHQAKPEPYLGRTIACTWQIGEMAMLAAVAGVPVVSNFRPADMAAGGEGAPLVPLLDFTLFRHSSRGRVLQNLGGIGNLTAIPPGAAAGDLLAFDTGPGNMVIDQLMQTLFHRPFDRNGKTASRGHALERVVVDALGEKFFRMPPPKSAGREQFGDEYARRFLAACRKAGGGGEDAVATATALTARSVRLAYERFCRKRMRGAPVDFAISGGGARNAALMRMLREELEPLGCSVVTSDALGLPSQAKEAAAFALLAYQTWHRGPGNVPAATGASRPAILGQIAYA